MRNEYCNRNGKYCRNIATENWKHATGIQKDDRNIEMKMQDNLEIIDSNLAAV